MARAFTLIEALIAIALGAVVVGTAFAGLRAAASCTTIANRLSVENALMREGYLLASDELDFWRRCDDPDPAQPAATARRLRAGDGHRGCAFTPFAAVDAMAADDGAGDREAERGWDPDDACAPADPRTWFRGDLAEKTTGSLMHGRYAILTGTEAVVDVRMPGWFAATQGSASVGASYGTVTVPHHWLDRRVIALFDALGFYGVCDYLPPDAFYDAIVPYGDGDPETTPTATSPGGRAMFLAHTFPTVEAAADARPAADLYFGTARWFTNQDGVQRTPKDLFRLTLETVFAMPDPSLLPSAADALEWSRRRYHVGFSWDNTPGVKTRIMDTFLRRTAVAGDPLPLRPSAWPEVRVTVHRFIRSRRFTAIAVIRWTSPVTGEVAQLTFSGFGTTLRGARQQRALAGGWARWDDATGAVGDRTLDAPTAGWTPAPHPPVAPPVLR